MHDAAHGVLTPHERRGTIRSASGWRLSGLQRHGALSPLSSRPSPQYATERRSRYRSVGAVPDHARKFPPQDAARISPGRQVSSNAVRRFRRPRKAGQSLVPNRTEIFRRKLGGPVIANLDPARRSSRRRQAALLSDVLAAAAATWQQVITRIRNIAEHAVVPDNDASFRAHAQPMRNGWNAPSRALLGQLSRRSSSDDVCSMLQSAEAACACCWQRASATDGNEARVSFGAQAGDVKRRGVANGIISRALLQQSQFRKFRFESLRKTGCTLKVPRIRRSVGAGR